MQQSLKETRVQGTPMHPLKIYEMKEENGKIDVPYHWQETVEILWIQTGTLSLMIRDEQFTGNPCDIFYVNPRELHGMQSVTADCTYLAFIFPISWLQFVHADEAAGKYLNPLISQSAHIATQLPRQTAVRVTPILQEIFTLYKNEDIGAWLGIKADLLRFYCDMYRDGMVHRSHEDSCQMSLLLDLSRFIQEHSSENLTLKILGERFHMSPKYFSVYFQKHFARNFTDYLTAVRIEHAKKLLLETSFPMELIAQQTGFSSSSYFIRTFHESTGLTPRQFRLHMQVQSGSHVP